MIAIRLSSNLYHALGEIENGTFRGLWHFSFGDYYDAGYMGFGTLRVFNDDRLSPGAVWPLHRHENIEVVTYCAEGRFRHADENGPGGVLEKGWVQRTSVGKGMSHSEINESDAEPMRFIQMWFVPTERNVEPSVAQKRVTRDERTNRFVPIVSNSDPGALTINSDAKVCSSLLRAGKSLDYKIARGRGAYLYVVEDGPVSVNDKNMPAMSSARIIDEPVITVQAGADAELLLVDVPL